MSESEAFTSLARPGFAADFPELHHYTSFGSFQGIYESHSLWATHFEDLNDSSEVVHLRDPLTSALARKAREGLLKWRGDSLRRRLYLQQKGGLLAIARGLADDLVSALYSTAFQRPGADLPLATPFVTSFCTHKHDHSYERENGLLSQWRGYGSESGVCLVFDTAALDRLLVVDYARAFWVHMSLGEAHYRSDEDAIAELFPNLVAQAYEVFAPKFEGKELAVPEDLFTQLVSGATRYKHRAFFEEREVRLTLIPGQTSTVEKMKEEHPEFEPAPLKEIHIRSTPRGSARYVVAMEGQAELLPIRRVIVGPGANQSDTVSKVKDLVGNTLPIRASETPLI